MGLVASLGGVIVLQHLLFNEALYIQSKIQLKRMVRKVPLFFHGTIRESNIIHKLSCNPILYIVEISKNHTLTISMRWYVLQT